MGMRFLSSVLFDIIVFEASGIHWILYQCLDGTGFRAALTEQKSAIRRLGPGGFKYC